LKRREINAISAVPSLWRVLLANQELIGQSGKQVRWIEIGSQYMSRAEKEDLKRLFPEARIVQHYGLTEASRTTLLQIHHTEGVALESVGRALQEVEIKLTEAGQIAIRGEHVASHYLIEGRQAALQDDQGWFYTKDLGELEDGYLYYKGRADDIINCGGIKVNPDTLETKIYARIGYGSGLAVCRKSDPLRGEGFLVATTPELKVDRETLRAAVLQATQECGVNAGNAIALVTVESLPKTATGKVQRRQLVEWYASQVQEAEPSPGRKTQGTPLQIAFCRALNLAQARPQDTFVALGGDSLSYVQLSMEVEKYLGYLPSGWETMELGQLEQLKPQKRNYATVETSILLRAIAITEVVMLHADLIMLGGGAYALLLIAGANFARFQGEALLQNQFSKSVLSLLKNLILPYLILSVLFQIYKRDFNPGILFFVSNYAGNPELTPSIFPVWFINVLVQTVLLVSALLFVNPIRRYVVQFPWRSSVLLLGIGVCTNQWIPLLWDANHRYNRVPHMLVWLFALGCCIYFVQTRTQKLLTTIALVALSIGLVGPAHKEAWVVCTVGLALLWIRAVPVPTVVKPGIQVLGAAAYYIYLTHMIFIHILKNTLGIGNPFLDAIVSLVGGVLVWFGVTKVQALFNQLRFNWSCDPRWKRVAEKLA
jgi:peptidoglycan/LPS O-acetylase OafA/YrhL